MPHADWLRYQRQQFSSWRSLGLAMSLINVAVSPLLFWFDANLQQSGAPLLQVRTLYAVHTYALLFSLTYLVYFWRTRKRKSPYRSDLVFLTYGTSALILFAAVIASANQLNQGSITIFAICSAFAIVISYLRPWLFGVVMLAATVIVVTSASLFQHDPITATATQVNAILIGVVTTFLYALFDRFRFHDFLRRERLEELVQLRNTLFHAIGHELRSPLVHVRRVARVIDEVKSQDARLHGLAGELDAASNRFGTMLDNLLAIEPLPEAASNLPRGPASLMEAFERVRDLHLHDARHKGVSLGIRFSDDVVVAADSETLVAVLNNLVANAIKFTPKGGAVSLRAKLHPDTVSIRVRDNGIGVSPSIRSLIQHGKATPPTTGTDGEPGLGIGLSVTRPLLTTHHRVLTLEPNTPHGTIAQFALPRYRTG